jgi:hypothetical protein
MDKPYNLERPIKDLEFKIGDVALHGDVIVERVSSLPKGFSEMPKSIDDCLAYGEHTGHKHKLFRAQDPDLVTGAAFDLRISPDGLRFLKVNEPVALRHQEHREIMLPPGENRISIQREYDPFTKLARRVMD